MVGTKVDVDYVGLRRDPVPSAGLLAGFDPRIFVWTVDEVLAVTERPLHRAILANYRRHGILEMLGRWSEIVVPELMAADPVYSLCLDGRSVRCAGLAEVRAMYGGFASAANVVFGPLWERIAVADWGLAMETFLCMPNSGVFLNQVGYDVDPGGFYAVTRWVTQIWPYDRDAKLVGEMIVEDPSSVRVSEIEAGSVISVAQAAALLEPLLDAPLPEPAA